jgi:hypothetical protein
VTDDSPFQRFYVYDYVGQFRHEICSSVKQRAWILQGVEDPSEKLVKFEFRGFTCELNFKCGPTAGAHPRIYRPNNLQVFSIDS